MQKIHGKIYEIMLNEENGSRVRIFPSSHEGDVPTGVTVQFDTEAFTAAFTSSNPEKLDRIIASLVMARHKVWA